MQWNVSHWHQCVKNIIGLYQIPDIMKVFLYWTWLRFNEVHLYSMTIKNSARAPCTELHYTSPLCLCARIRSSQETPMLKEVRLHCDVMDMGGCNWLVHLWKFSFIWWQTICEVRYSSVEHASEFHVILCMCLYCSLFQNLRILAVLCPIIACSLVNHQAPLHHIPAKCKETTVEPRYTEHGYKKLSDIMKT